MPLRFQSLTPKEFLTLHNHADTESKISDFKNTDIISTPKHAKTNSLAIVIASILKGDINSKSDIVKEKLLLIFPIF